MSRFMSGKGGKGKGGGAKAAPAPPPPPTLTTQKQTNPNLFTAGQRLRRKRPAADALTLLSPGQRALAEQLAQPPAPPAVEGQAAPPAPPAPPHPLGALSPPLSPGEVGSLLQQSLSGAAGRGVAFNPVVFGDIFQSAPALASYVASALESGTGWPRLERFLIAATEGRKEGGVWGVRVQVNGRLGRKTGMAERKVWSWGAMGPGALRHLEDRVDWGMAAANTRMGALGVKVWIRYRQGAVADVFYSPGGGSTLRAAPAPAALSPLSLDELYEAACRRTTRLQLPYSFRHVGWWERTATEQPAENRVGEAFVSGLYQPPGNTVGAAGDGTAAGGGAGTAGAVGVSSLAQYFVRRREEARRFRSAAERQEYMATIGRFLAKQKRMERAQAGASAAAADLASAAPSRPAMGRRPNRVLARFDLSAYAVRPGRVRRTA